MELQEKLEAYGRKLQAYRHRVGYKNQYQLAVAMDCGAIQISNYESGKTIPSRLTAKQLIETLNLTRDEAIEFINETNALRIERRKQAHGNK